MADDGYRKPLRADDSFGRTTGAAAPSGGSDPLAELARLIGQTDPFAEFGRTQRAADIPPERPNEPHLPRAFAPFDRSQQTMPAPDAYDQQQYGLPLAAQPNFPADDYGQPPAGSVPGMAGQGFHDRPGYETAAFAPDPTQRGDELYDDDVPPRRHRVSVLAIAGVFALAVIGTAGALGYRALFGTSGVTPPPIIKADAAPSKVVPPASAGQSNKLINDRIGDKAQGEKLVSREEEPVDLARQATPAVMTGGAVGAGTTGPAANAAPGGSAGLYEPKKIKTIAIRPDQPGAPSAAAAAAAAVSAPQQQPTARSNNAPMSIASIAEQADDRPATRPAPVQQQRTASSGPLSLTPGASPSAQPAPTARTATAPAAASNGNGSGYAVQVSSQRSEADAQASFRNMQTRFPGQLSGRQALIRRADLGSKGVYYRAMVGPFANAGDATELCNSLKAAGGQCIVQKI